MLKYFCPSSTTLITLSLSYDLGDGLSWLGGVFILPITTATLVPIRKNKYLLVFINLFLYLHPKQTLFGRVAPLYGHTRSRAQYPQRLEIEQLKGDVAMGFSCHSNLTDIEEITRLESSLADNVFKKWN